MRKPFKTSEKRNSRKTKTVKGCLMKNGHKKNVRKLGTINNRY